MDSKLNALVEKRQKTVNKLISTMVDQLNLTLSPDDIDPDAPLFGTGLDLDSIDAVELIVLVEKAFSIKFREDFNVYNIRTINKMADAIIKIQDQQQYE
jgi:acyl carrier protein